MPEQKCVQTRKDPQGILAVLPRGLTQYGRISAHQNRVCPCQLMVLSFLERVRQILHLILFMSVMIIPFQLISNLD